MNTGKQLEVEGLSSGLEDRNEPAEETGVNLQSSFQEKKLPAIVEDGMQLVDCPTQLILYLYLSVE